MTPEAERMAAIVAQLAPLLKHEGFRKRRHCFNRLVSDGIVHAGYFWMAPKEPPLGPKYQEFASDSTAHPA